MKYHGIIVSKQDNKIIKSNLHYRNITKNGPKRKIIEMINNIHYKIKKNQELQQIKEDQIRLEKRWRK